MNIQHGKTPYFKKKKKKTRQIIKPQKKKISLNSGART